MKINDNLSLRWLDYGFVVKAMKFVQFVGLILDVEMVTKYDDHVMGLFWMMKKL